MTLPSIPIVPASMLNWGKRVSDKLKEDEVPVPTGNPLTPEEEQQIADELDDDPIFTKEENALIRKAKKEAEEKRKQDEADLADAQKIGEIKAERDPSKLKGYKEEGIPLDKEQEKIAWKYERDMPTTRKVGDFIRRAGKGLEDIATDIPVGTYKLAKYGLYDPLKSAGVVSPEEEAKIDEKQEQAVRSFGSGVVGGLEDLVYELPKTVYKGGTPITDFGKELVGLQTEEDSYKNYLKRKAVGEEIAKEEERMPERSSALLENVSLGLGKIGALDKTFSKDLAQQFRERALTKEQLIPEISTIGDVFAPDIPFMDRLAPLTAKTTGAISTGALKGLTGVQIGNRRIGVAPAVEKIGWGGRRLGEKINEYSAKIDRAISGSDDWIFRNAVGKTSNFLGRGSGLVEGVGRFGTDIGRVIDTGIAGRKGVAERLGESSTTGRLGNILFGDASQGLRKKLGEMSPVEAAEAAEKAAGTMEKRARQGLARARAVDSASRLAQYYAKAGINGAAVQVMLGLPNMETWGDVGEAVGYGGGMGVISASSPKSLFVDRVRADQRAAAEADIGRMMVDLDDTTKDKLKSLADPVNFVNQLNKRKEVVDSRLGLLREIVDSAKKRTIGNVTITPRDAQSEIDHLEGKVLPSINKSITDASKTNPQTQKEIEFIINKEFMDSLGNLKTVADQSGIGGDIDVKMLSTDEIGAAFDEMYKSQKEAAAETIKLLGGQELLSPEDKKQLDDAMAFENFLDAEKENMSSQRGFALTPAKDRTQLGWWTQGAPVNKPTIVVNSDELKNSRGLDIASVLRHEMFHGILQFQEVQDMMKEQTDILFDQYSTDEEGNRIKESDGIVSDEKLRQMADKYSAKYNPVEKGMWRAMFETDADLLNAIKEEFLAESFTQSGGATGMTSNVEDSVVENVLDYARAQSSSSTLGRIRDTLGKMGISIDDSGRSNVLESEIPSQAIALMRQFRRTLRDYNGTLEQIGQADLSDRGAIPITKIASSKVLFKRYKDADFWEREAATTVTLPDGTIESDQALPKSAQDKLVAGEWTVQDGKLVPVDPEYTAQAPAALKKMAKGKPNGTKIVAGVRIAMNADGSPRILSKSAVEAISRKRSSLIKAAIDTAPEDGTSNRFRDTGNGNYRGVMSPSQIMAISQIPDIVLPPKMKTLIRKINEMLLRGDGSRFNTEYQAALRGGKYRGMAPRISDDVPIGFQFSKEGNFLVTTVSVTRLNNKLNAWAKEMPGRLALWDGSKYDFWADFVKVLDNQKKNLPGETDLDGDPQIALEKKNVINDLLNLYNKDTELTNPSRTKLKQKRGQDSKDRTIVSRRLDRMLRLDENNAEKLPINYGKVISNALPQEEFDFGDGEPTRQKFYQDFEILNKKSGEYAGQPVRISVDAESAEEAEKLIRRTPKYKNYNSTYRFNSIGAPYSSTDQSEQATPEDFAEMRKSAGLGTSSKALPDIANPSDLISSLDKVLGTKNVADERISNWLKKRYKQNFIQSSPEEVSEMVEPYAASEGDPEWMKKEGLYRFLNLSSNENDRISHMIDYMNQLSDSEKNSLYKEPFEVVANKVAEWTESLKKKMGKKLKAVSDKDIVPAMEFEDGYSIFRLKSKKAYEEEGDAMGHCVGSYSPDNKESTIYSLRDKDGFPHATIEVRKKEDTYSAYEDGYVSLKKRDRGGVYQIKGKENAAPVEKYAIKIAEFIKKENLKVYEDGDSIGMLFYNNEYYFEDSDDWRQIYEEKILPKQKRILENISSRVVDDTIAGDVEISDAFFRSIPEVLAGKKITGNFISNRNQLTSLAGAPASVTGNFDFRANQLTSLAGAPGYVGGNFDVGNNQLTSLAGAPASVTGNFHAYKNKLTSLAGAPASVAGNFNVAYNQLTSLAGAPASVTGNFLVDSNKLESLAGAPASVTGNFDASYNKLESLAGAPASVGDNFYAKTNQLKSLEGAPASVGLDFDVRDNQLKSLAGAPGYVGANFDVRDNQLKSLEGAPPVVDGNILTTGNPIKSGKVDFAKALPREISGNPTFWKDLYHYTDKDSAEAISIGGFDISKSTEERLFPNTISLTTKDSWNVGDAAVLNELSAENPVIVRVSGNQREGEIGLWDFAKEDEEVSPMELGKRLVDWAQSQGHDVIVARGVPGPGKEYAVLDPSKIKVKSFSKALPKDLSQVTLDERKAKLPKYKTIDKITSKRTNGRLDGYYEIDGSVELADPENNDKIGSATYSIFGDADSKFGRSLVVGFSFVNDKYISKGYGEGLYRELAKIAQKHGATEIVGETSPDARKVRNKLFPELTTNWEDAEGKNDMVSQVNPSTKYLPKSKQDLSQVSLDERKAKLPKVTFEVEPKQDEESYVERFTALDEEGNTIGNFSYFKTKDSIFVDQTYIVPEYQKRGYGEQIYRELAKIAQADGLKFIYSDQVSEKAAQARNRIFEEKENPWGSWDAEGDAMTSIVNPTTKYLPISPEETDAVREYQNGIYNSEVGGYSNIQSVLRYGKPKYADYWNDEVGQKYIEGLLSAFQKSELPEDQTVYRGVVLPVGKRDEIFQLKKGDVISDSGITSASTDKDKVESKFQTKLNKSDRLVYYTIDLSKGTKAIDVGEITGENIESEIAIAPNTEFRVVSSQNKGGTTYINLESVAGSGSKALPKDLSQVTLDERKAKLPPYRSRINYGGRQQFVAIYQDNDKGIEIGRAEYSIERDIDDVVTMFIESSKVSEAYRNKGYGEALYRELAKLAQDEGVTRIEGLANKDAVKVREKLFEKKPDPLGLDMHRIDLINPTTKYLPKSDQDSENYKNYILGKINSSGEERFEIKTNESGKNIYVKKDAPEMPPASTLAREIWQDENLNMYGNSIKTGITKNEWEEFLNDFLKENPESEFAKERKEYLDREKNRKQDAEIRQSQAEALGFVRRQPLESYKDFLNRIEIEQTREGSPFNPNSENFLAYLRINGQAFSPEESAMIDWTISSRTADEWNSLYLISKLGKEKAFEYIEKLAELGAKIGIDVNLSPDSISTAKSSEVVPEEAIANDFWSALRINMASGKFDDIEAMMNEKQELANSRYRDFPEESFEQSRVRRRETESKIQKLEEQIKNRTRALVAISTMTQAQARFSKVGEFKQLVPTINKIKSEAIAELPKKQMIAYRGMVFRDSDQMQKKIEEAFERQGYYDFAMQPLSSWTLKESLAKTFARHGQGKKQYGSSGEGIIISQPITADNVVMHPNQTMYKDFVSRRADLGEKFNSGGSDQKEAILESLVPIRLTPQNTKFIKFLPNSDEEYDNRFVQEIENSSNPMQPQKQRGLQFLKYAEEEEEPPAPLSSLMLN